MKKIFILLLLFILAELYLIIVLGQYIGPAYTIVYIVFSAIAGYALAYQSLMRFKKYLTEKIKTHKVSLFEALDWLVTLMGALLILIPGILTDILGIVLSVKALREGILKSLWPLIKDSEFVALFKNKLKEELQKKGLQDIIRDEE